MWRSVPERVSNLCVNPLNVPKVSKADKYSSNSNDLLIEMWNYPVNIFKILLHRVKSLNVPKSDKYGINPVSKRPGRRNLEIRGLEGG